MTGDDLQPDTADDGFARALLTPHVRHVTVAYQLVGWQIEHRDLILTRKREVPHTASEVLQIAEQLVALAKRFPTDAAHSYGHQPTFDIPLPTDAAQTTT